MCKLTYGRITIKELFIEMMMTLFNHGWTWLLWLDSCNRWLKPCFNFSTALSTYEYIYYINWSSTSEALGLLLVPVKEGCYRTTIWDSWSLRRESLHMSIYESGQHMDNSIGDSECCYCCQVPCINSTPNCLASTSTASSSVTYQQQQQQSYSHVDTTL